MNAAWTIFKKEMKETLRDRRTLLIMIVMPLLLIPVILGLASNITASQAEAELQKDVRIGFFGNDNGSELLRWLDRRRDFRVYTDIEPMFFKDLIREDSLEIGIILGEDFDENLENNRTGSIQVFYNSTNEIHYDRVLETLEAYHEDVLDKRLALMQADKQIIRPTAIEQVDVYTQRESLGKMVGGFLPYIFVVFCLLGAMYPSIDLFTGEKERETLETILTVPASRLQILLGKMGTITLAGIISGGLAILGLYLSIQFNPEFPDFMRNIILQILNPTAIFQILLLIIPLTIFFAGVLIPASIYARSFKEAQTIIQPMLILVIIPLALVAILPNVELNFFTAVLPIVNVGLACRDIIAGTLDIGLFIVVFISLVVLAGIGVGLCIRWFWR